MKISIKWALLLAFTAVITLSTGFIITSSYHTSKDALLLHANKVMNNIVAFTTDKSKNHILVAKDATELTQGLASKRVVNSENFKGIEEYFFEQLQINKQFSNIYYANKQGEFVMVSRLSNEPNKFSIKKISYGDKSRKVTFRYIDKRFKTLNEEELKTDTYDPRVRPWFKMADKYRRTIWTDPYIFYTSKQPGITIAAPVLAKSDILKGVVGIDIEIQELSNFISKLDFSKNGKIFIIDQKTNMIASDKQDIVKHSVDNGGSLKLLSINDTDDEALKIAYKTLLKDTSLEKIDKKVFLTFNYKNKIYHAIFSPFKINDIKWIIGIYIPEDEYLGDIKENQTINIYIGIMIAIVSLFISFIISDSISKPISNMQKVAHELKLHHLNAPKIPLSKFSEISESVEAFNEMKDELVDYEEKTNKLNQSLKEASLDTLYRLAVAAEYKDNETAQHIKRIGAYSQIIAKTLGMSEEDIYILEHASIMHDVGKLGIPDNILRKPAKLTDEERKIIQTHSIIGKKILDNPSSDVMNAACQIAAYHHEKYDGTGYPYQLKGEDIPIMARIVAVADVFDALVSKRCYKEAFSLEKSFNIIKESSGKHFDPKCVEAFEKSFDEITKVYEKYNKYTHV